MDRVYKEQIRPPQGAAVKRLQPAEATRQDSRGVASRDADRAGPRRHGRLAGNDRQSVRRSQSAPQIRHAGLRATSRSLRPDRRRALFTGAFPTR